MPDRDLPPRIEDRLIVALDVPDVGEARALVDRLDGVVSFFKLGLWLAFAAGFDGLVEELRRRGKRIFLDAKLYDIGETVREGAARAAERGVTFLTVHGDAEIMRAAVAGRAGAPLKIFAITVLTSLDERGLADLGATRPVEELVRRRARLAVECGVDGIIAAPRDNPDEIRRLAGSDRLLVATPGVRLAGHASDDHKRAGTPRQAIAAGADYLVVGRPIIRSPDPAEAARLIIEDMRSAA
ncbi:MAG TPA: orotidine-5'-phosphate decarboxylase [Stellaceae bacterium]|nr:orotidine-5'-phosphate decarboxylase [Stellaceae bacterium]